MSLVIITGSRFTHVHSVSFGAQKASLFLAVNSRIIIALAPTEPVGTVDVTVTTAAGTSPTSSADRYTFLN
jgi:hypothetical protein